MRATMRTTIPALALAAGLALSPVGASWLVAPALAQTATETPAPALTPSTGPDAPLTLGTGETSATFAAGGGSGETLEFEDEPLPSTGGGDLAFAAAGLLAAAGVWLRAVSARRD